MLASSSATSSATADLSKLYLLEHRDYRTLTGTGTIEALGSRHLKSVTLSMHTLRSPSISWPDTWGGTRATASPKESTQPALQGITRLSCYLLVDPKLQCRF